MDLFDLSSALFGRKGMDSDSVEYEETTRTYVGTATSDSADGSVYVELSEDVTMPDEYEGEHGMGVEMPTVPGVSEGDEVLVTVFGSGAMKSPVVTGNAGEGDRQNAAIAAARGVADAAHTVAEAVNQHFFADTNGIHVTEATQEDWNTDHSGANVLINSIGQLFRDGLNNLLTLTAENGARALTIWDGLGNAASNVVATFDKDGIGLVGGAFRLTSERVTEEYGDENNPTTSTEIRSVMKSEGSNDDFETRCFLRSMVGEDDDAYYNSIELTSETDIKTQSPTETNNASVEVGSDQWGSSVRLVADSQELHLHKHPVDGKDYFDLHSEVFLITDYHNGVNMWSTAPGTVLWSGGWHMTAGHTANLKYNVSTCHTGIVLHFQPYTNSTIRNWNHIYYFVPKEHVASYNGSGIVVRLGNPDFSNLASKYLYISNDHITGNDQNNTSGTNSGVSYNNAAWVMTQVIAV